ncbi:MAG: 23S rRNA pseudouridine(2605) synthase RluB [Gammaproteobacteria bacterium]
MKRKSPPAVAVGERIQKVLAAAGFGSRREIEGWIKAGRLSINRHAAQLGDRIKPTDWVALDGRSLQVDRSAPLHRRVILYHKPEGELTTRRDPEGRATVFEALPHLHRGRWVNIGRLDFNTSGLLLFTNDGELANRLMHPTQQIEREYAVRVLGKVGEPQLHALVDGVQLEDGPARFLTLHEAGGEGANHWYHVTLREGRKREVRRLWEAVGAKVSRLIRVRYADIHLTRDLPRGACREARPEELEVLLTLAGLAGGTRTGKLSAGRQVSRRFRSRKPRSSDEKNRH